MKILIIDDDPLSLSGVKMLLEQCGSHQCCAFQNPAEAVQTVAAGGYDAVISDWRMPELSGLEVLQQIHTINPALPVILMTGHKYDELEIQRLQPGPYAFFTKPLRAHTILETLRQIAGGGDQATDCPACHR